jgi:peptidoglycan/LPS O-acetylase OafA/YrhL
MPFILSQVIDACRWVGALLVLAVHGTNMFVSLADIMSAPHSAPVYAWWFVVSFELGHQAVVGFFVMSGYLVGGAVLAQLAKQQDFLREYMIHRVARIYIVLVPALLLTFIVDTAGRAFFSSSGVYDWPVFQGHFAPRLMGTNLLNLQGILSDFYGTNGPLWSLACEFWYYVTFPLLLLPFARNYSPRLRLGGFLLGLGLFLVFAIPSDWFRFGFLLWAMGALATLAPRPLMKSRWLALALYAAIVIPIRLLVRGPVLAAHPWLQDAADLTTAIFFVNLAVTLRYGPREGWALFRPRLHKELADFSFSLYSIHMPVLILVRAAAATAWGPAWAKQLATPAHWAALAVAMSLAIAAGYVFSRYTEAHTGAARKFLRRTLPGFEPAPLAEAAAPAPPPSHASRQ